MSHILFYLVLSPYFSPYIFISASFSFHISIVRFSCVFLCLPQSHNYSASYIVYVVSNIFLLFSFFFAYFLIIFQIVVFCVGTPRSFPGWYYHFGGICCLHIQGRSQSDKIEKLYKIETFYLGMGARALFSSKASTYRPRSNSCYNMADCQLFCPSFYRAPLEGITTLLSLFSY
jgi:hypothetical protein